MTEAPEVKDSRPIPEGTEPPVSLGKILKQNPFLVKMLIFFFLMLFVPLVLAWKFDWFLVAN